MRREIKRRNNENENKRKKIETNTKDKNCKRNKKHLETQIHTQY